MGDAILQAKYHISGSFFVISPYHLNAGDILKSFLKSIKNQNQRRFLSEKDRNSEIYGILKYLAERRLELWKSLKKGRAVKYARSRYLLSAKQFWRALNLKVTPITLLNPRLKKSLNQRLRSL